MVWEKFSQSLMLCSLTFQLVARSYPDYGLERG